MEGLMWFLLEAVVALGLVIGGVWYIWPKRDRHDNGDERER